MFIVFIFLFVVTVLYTYQTEERIKVRIPERENRSSFVSTPSAVESNNTEPRLNVILLTFMSSGSTVAGNMFNLHPDVFYIYEPLHGLRRKVYTKEWLVLNKSRNDAFRKDFSTLLGDLFTCGFQEESTIELAFPKWVRRFNTWYEESMSFTKDSLRNVCNARKISATKIMQSRLPREIGIREVERVCRSEPSKFDCLIVHLVRDPRAVLSSLIRRAFFMGRYERYEKSLLTEQPLSAKGISLLKNNAQMLCSLIEENLNYVHSEWSNWFKGHYILVRYEDAISNMSRAVNDIYKSIGLDQVETISNWIKGVPPPGRSGKTMVISNTTAAAIDNWRSHESSSMVSLFEETCGPLMKTMGYIFVNGSETLQHNNSKPLRTANIPFLINLHSQTLWGEE